MTECRHLTVAYVEGRWFCDNPSCKQEFTTALDALTPWLTRKEVLSSYPSWCMADSGHRRFVTDGTGMLLCAECGSGCETDYGVLR